MYDTPFEDGKNSNVTVNNGRGPVDDEENEDDKA